MFFIVKDSFLFQVAVFYIYLFFQNLILSFFFNNITENYFLISVSMLNVVVMSEFLWK